MAAIDQFWMVLLNFLTHPASQGIAIAVVALMSALIAWRVLPDFVADSSLLPRGTAAATLLRVVVVLAGVAAFAAAAASLIIILPQP
jgi:hypothetical protein